MRQSNFITHSNLLLELSLTTNILAGSPLNYENLYKGINLHDIALAAMPEILSHEREPTQDEIQELKLHPVKSAELLHAASPSEQAELFVMHHHERIDGSGFPYGLKGDNISEEGKLAAIVDSFHNAMEKHAIMGLRESILVAIFEINIHTGKHYDKTWVRLFNNMLREHWLPDWREQQLRNFKKVG